MKTTLEVQTTILAKGIKQDEYSGKITFEQYTTLKDVIDIIWHADLNKYDKKAFKKLKEVVAEWEEEMEGE